jgi:uncharacterized protein (UPF0548 family)
MFFLRRPTAGALDRLLSHVSLASATYSQVGATAGGELPDGYRHDVDELLLGSGSEVFKRAVSAVRSWQAQLGAGIELVPARATVAEGQTVLLLIRAAGLWAVAPCRVVYVSEEAHRFGFAYATLPGHPEEGEASFAVIHEPNDDVVFRVASFSRPVDPLARLAKPWSRRIQRRVTLRYLTSIKNATS